MSSESVSLIANLRRSWWLLDGVDIQVQAESAADRIEELEADARRKQDALNHLLDAVYANARPDLMRLAIHEAEAAL